MKNIAIVVGIFIIGIIAFYASIPLMNKNVPKSKVQVDNVINVGKQNSAANQVNSFTIESVALHNTKDDCYLASNGKVYDVTDFIKAATHKAGVEVIINNCGKDVTESFAKAHDGKPNAMKMIQKFEIGVVK